MFGAMAALVAMAAVPLAGQAPQATAKAPTSAEGWTQPRTAWGDPDLQGVWRGLTAVALERPAAFAGREFLTDAEVARLAYFGRPRNVRESSAWPGVLCIGALVVRRRPVGAFSR